MAVDKGHADKNPNELEKFVGDYVFNPLSGQTSIQINQPVQVEAGTGFLMVQRHAFEKLQQVYPQLSYKPDHVRTEHFDGSREIHAYFDCVIERDYTFDDVQRFMENGANIGANTSVESTMSLVSQAKKMLEQKRQHRSATYQRTVCSATMHKKQD